MGTRDYEAGSRPRVLDEYIGQDRVRLNLQVAIAAAMRRGEPLDHVLLYGSPGLGKTTLAYIIANELGVTIRVISGSALEKPGDLVGIVTNMAAGEVLFIDEIHRLSRAVEEMLYPALDEYTIEVVIGVGPTARTVAMRLEKFTLIGATTRTEFLTSPQRSRFGIVHRLEPYGPAELQEMVRRSARALGVPIEDEAAGEIARRARGTPGIAVGLLRRIRDFAEVQADGTITRDVAHAALELLDLDEMGIGHQSSGTPREPIPDEVKKFVWQRDQGRCVKCGSRELLEYDHIIPLAKAGSNTARNLQLLCEGCNRQKGAAI
jgi:Holliday junction DNA helicase RuvB